ncbi:glycosyltransferase family 2 protein [Flavihumibacter fluvii]|uniref:glycosyltransferase family 2 protein n=1 Tax=Flavihumibacter fluvii TaxID=2838157 RepID=UPI001BDE44AE|nr:glycosyltransferase family 2 protein [Flavihumibacter fluvii]ULQ51667.1 glycosyltransferase family 2 protein [Flavihumibacter fluvii]
MRLSVIIVNYNVCYFLEQCLYTVMQATEGIAAEIFVVDNASTDDSRQILPNRFPAVQFIWKESNTGFGHANNLALSRAKGEYLAILNPDTLVPQNVFTTCLQFFDHHPDAGGVGMRMYDGCGQYLPESKRGWPGAWTAFFKLSGLSAVFPRNRRIARYYLGHLSPEQVHLVEVLAGAFMVFPRKVYEQVGGFDEQFFMYGEDIDLSYRISLAGYTNYYLPNPGILHFKGESTTRNATYTRHFYEAMLIFVRKYYPQQSGAWKALLEAAIKTRELIARIGRTNAGKKTGQKMDWQLAGDSGVIPEIADLIPQVAKDKTSDQGIIYALGSDFGMQQVLESWQSGGPPKAMRFHGAGTAGIVGSDDKNGQGEVILLKKSPLV